MKVVHEAEVDRDPAQVTRLWAASESFVLAPTRAGSGRSWLTHAIALVPESHGQRHFGLLTSGSAGDPKLVIGSRARAEALAEVIHERQDNDPARQTICLLPLSYSYAFVNQWVWSHRFGRRFVTTAGFSDPAGTRAALEAARDAMVCMVGAQVPLLLQLFPTATFPGVVRLHFAGARFPQERLEDLARAFPNAKVFNNYGCAEAMPRLTIRGAWEAPAAQDVGKALPGISVRARDDVLQFRSVYSATLVVENGVAHAIPGEEWIPTGDLGQVAADGTVLLTGRASEVYKRFGEKISLPQVQTAVQGVWKGHAALYRTTDEMGEGAHVLVLAPAPDDKELKGILALLRASFARPHWPLRIESVGTLPLLPNGKPDLRRLADTARRSTVHWAQRY